jgi:hypothetical protein
MPIKPLMTWVQGQRRWTKKYRGRMYSVSCKQLGTGETKGGSLLRAARAGGTPSLIQAMDEGRVSLSAASVLVDADPDEQDAVLELDERAALQAAKEIRQRQAEKRAEHQQEVRTTGSAANRRSYRVVRLSGRLTSLAPHFPGRT